MGGGAERQCGRALRRPRSARRAAPPAARGPARAEPHRPCPQRSTHRRVFEVQDWVSRSRLGRTRPLALDCNPESRRTGGSPPARRLCCPLPLPPRRRQRRARPPPRCPAVPPRLPRLWHPRAPTQQLLATAVRGAPPRPGCSENLASADGARRRRDPAAPLRRRGPIDRGAPSFFTAISGLYGDPPNKRAAMGE